MITTTRRGPTSYEAHLLAMADRLFADFDTLPVRDVLHAIGNARSELRDRGERQPDPRTVENLARGHLQAAHQAA
jgi:hypothetical protein